MRIGNVAKVLFFGSIIACASASAPSANSPSAPDAPASSDIARIHKARCGACHVRVEPGERTRAELEDALARHRTRTKLTEDQWKALVDYLAAPATASAK